MVFGDTKPSVAMDINGCHEKSKDMPLTAMKSKSGRCSKRIDSD
jgi:hypothetical protein